MMSELKMITASELRADIKKGLHGVYLFCGPEEYMISAYTDMVRQSVTGGDETAQTLGSVQMALLSGVINQWLVDPSTAPTPAQIAAGLRALAAVTHSNA